MALSRQNPLAQLLAGQRWTEVRVPFADDGQSTNGQTFVQLAVAGTGALVGDGFICWPI